jgi:trimethylamine corrinoid protein
MVRADPQAIRDHTPPLPYPATGRSISVTRAKELSADVIGMSALLTTTMEEQKKVIKVIKEEGLPFKTVVGGAPCTQRWADQIGADAYAEDANDGVKKIDALLGR